MRIVWFDVDGYEHQETFDLHYPLERAMALGRIERMTDHGIRFSVDYCQCAPKPQADF